MPFFGDIARFVINSSLSLLKIYVKLIRCVISMFGVSTIAYLPYSFSTMLHFYFANKPINLNKQRGSYL